MRITKNNLDKFFNNLNMEETPLLRFIKIASYKKLEDVREQEKHLKLLKSYGKKNK